MSGLTFLRMSQLHALPALELVAVVRRGAASSTELVAHYLHRIERHAWDLGAFITVTAESAMTAAARADRIWSAGRSLAPLHGLPIGFKDLTMTAGVRTTMGSRVYSEFVPQLDDDVVRFLSAAGAISLGKTNVPEFGLCCYTENLLGPPARNPHDLTRMAGGSSGGSRSYSWYGWRSRWLPCCAGIVCTRYRRWRVAANTGQHVRTCRIENFPRPDLPWPDRQ